VQSVSQLIVSYEFLSQGILISLGTGTGRNLLYSGNNLALELSELYIFSGLTENTVVNSQLLYNFKISSALH
jgi:hypothetical protein